MWALFAGGVAAAGDAGGDTLWLLCVLEVMRCMLEAAEDRLFLLEVLEAMRRVLLCMLDAVEGELCLLDVLEAKEAKRCMLLCMQEPVEGGLCLLETLEAAEALDRGCNSIGPLLGPRCILPRKYRCGDASKTANRLGSFEVGGECSPDGHHGQGTPRRPLISCRDGNMGCVACYPKFFRK